MIGLISLVLPIFLLIGLGYAALRAGIASRSLVEALSVFVMNFAMPALILHALLQQDLRQTLNWGYLAAYAGGSLVAFATLMWVTRVLLARKPARATMVTLGGCASNSGFVGFPVASLAIGAPAFTALPLSMLVENIIIIPLALALAESTRTSGGGPRDAIRQTAARLVRMPLMIAILAGSLLSAVGFRPPDALAHTFEMLAAAAVPCALFVVGGTLATLRPGVALADVWLIAAVKLVLHPLLVFAAFRIIGGVPDDLMVAGMIMASSPMLTIYPILCARFGEGEMGAAALFVTTAASFVTLPVALALLGVGG